MCKVRLNLGERVRSRMVQLVKCKSRPDLESDEVQSKMPT